MSEVGRLDLVVLQTTYASANADHVCLDAVASSSVEQFNIIEKLAVEFQRDPLTFCWMDLQACATAERKKWDAQFNSNSARKRLAYSQTLHLEMPSHDFLLAHPLQRSWWRAARRGKRSRCTQSQAKSPKTTCANGSRACSVEKSLNVKRFRICLGRTAIDIKRY